jgi:cytidine deaminase
MRTVRTRKVAPDALLAAARAAGERAHAPYSHFRVGAAVRVGGRIFAGCNIENASYGLTICAERVAIFSAVCAGHRRIEALAVACIDARADAPAEERMPCGACRQVLAEFADPDMPVYVEGVGTFTVADLLPHPFRLISASDRSAAR